MDDNKDNDDDNESENIKPNNNNPDSMSTEVNRSDISKVESTTSPRNQDSKDTEFGYGRLY